MSLIGWNEEESYLPLNPSAKRALAETWGRIDGYLPKYVRTIAPLRLYPLLLRVTHSEPINKHPSLNTIYKLSGSRYNVIRRVDVY